MSNSVVPVVLLTGRKGSGKDTFGSFLNKALSNVLDIGNVRSLAFADPIKEAAEAIFGLPREILWGSTEVKDNTKTYGKTVRHILQWMGTEVFRDQIHPDIWVHGAVRRIVHDIRSSGSNSAFVITDCRFPNEWQTVKFWLEAWPDRILYSAETPEAEREMKAADAQLAHDAGITQPWEDVKCYLVKVLRPSALNSGDMHRSETSIDELDKFGPIVIRNDSSLEVLEAQAKELALRIKADLRPAVPA